MSTDHDHPTDARDAGTQSPVPPGQKIEELRKEAKDEQFNRKVAELKTQQVELKIQQIEAQIGLLGQVTEDIDKIHADYLKEYNDLVATRQSDENFETDEKKCLANILGNAVQTVTETVAKLRKPIVELDESIKVDEAALVVSKQTRDENEKARKATKEAFDKLKATAATIKDYQRDPLDVRRSQIKDAQDTGKFAVAYWLLVNRFTSELHNAPAIIGPDELRKQLLTARDAYVTAIAKFYASDTLVKAAEKDLAAKSARLDELKKNFEVEVRDELSKIKPQRQAA